MREKLLETKYQLEKQIANIDKAIKFFGEHPEMESMLEAYMAMMSRGMPVAGIY
jgi:hypothetical protein